jgi:hypothetical protein
VYSYLFHFLLSLFLFGIGIIAKLSDGRLTLPMLPWTGESLVTWVLWGGLAGILSVVLAVAGIFRLFFPLWSLTVLVLLVRGYFLQPYSFGGETEFQRVLWLSGGALLAFLGSLTVFGSRKKRRR